MNKQNWWNSLLQNMQSAFMLVEEGNSAPARLNVRAIVNCAFRLLLYGTGGVLVNLGLLGLLSSWDLDSWILGIGISGALILESVGLFLFFRRGSYRRGWKWADYFWWIVTSVSFLFILSVAATYFVPTQEVWLTNLIAAAWLIACGVDLMIIASIPRKKTQSEKNPPVKSVEASTSYQSIEPLHRFSELILPQDLLTDLQQAVEVVRTPKSSLDLWGLSDDARVSYVALHLYGKPGTGKTLAAHALADYLDQRILATTYADFQAEYILDINKKIQDAFDAAAREQALLFIDEADTLLTHGVSQMTSSRVRGSLEQFHGVVVFATNSIETYNKAFETRMRHIHIPMPDEACSQKLWLAKLPDSLPRSPEINPAVLAQQFSDLSGREIKRIVAEAVQKAISEQRPQLELSDLNAVVIRMKKERLHEDSDVTIDSLAKKQYEAQDPRYTFEDLVVSKKVEDELLRKLAIIQKEAKLFDEWGLRAIEKFPCTALNFYGPPGTGKTLAAHAVAKRLNQKILVASYGEIIGQLVGDAARNTNVIFRAATRTNAVLFIDEADALLARRLGNVTHSADMELNSLSNQMLIALENFHGVVIFATNMIHNYDKAFETRVSHIPFPMPDEECRQRLWRRHLPEKLPRTDDVDPVKLAAQIDDVCGRDIKNAVLEAAAQVDQEERTKVELHDLVGAIKRIKDSRISQQAERDTKRKQIAEHIQRQLFPENPGGTSFSQPSTRPLHEIFEESDQVILLQPLVQSEQSVTPESPEPVPATRQAAQDLVIRRNERSSDKEGPAAPETPVPTSIGLEQDNVDGETELNTPTQPLARLQGKPSGQLERIPD